MSTTPERSRRPGLLWLALAGTWGCTQSGAAEIHLLRVSPERLRLGAETALTVTGSNLRASIRVDLDSTHPPEIGHFIAWVGDLGPLTGVTPLDAERLQIVVPGELGLGTHALVIKETLSGRTGGIPNAVEVFDDGGAREDGGVEAQPTPTADAAVVEALDAGVEYPAPSSSGPDGPDAAGIADAVPGQCSGAAHAGLCWYLGAAGATCEQTCEAHGGIAPEAGSFVGTAAQGGGSARCAEILGLLGHGEPVIEASRTDVGIGCHLWGVEEQAYWLTAPNFDPTVGSSAARVVCGCTS